MAGPLLSSKCRLPVRREGAVARERLVERLGSATIRVPLTVLSAPAGFGKTTLLAEWLAAVSSAGTAIGWLALDRRDNDAALLWNYVVTAMRAAVPGFGGAATVGSAAGAPPIDAVLAALLNEMERVPGELVLVLDDYQVIQTPAVHEALAFLLDHQPAQLHLVIATRHDPATAAGAVARTRSADRAGAAGQLARGDHRTGRHRNRCRAVPRHPADQPGGRDRLRHLSRRRGTLIIVGVVCLLAVITLRADLAGLSDVRADALRVTGHALVEMRQRTFLLGPGLMAGINDLLLGYLMYRSRLVPRIIPIIGLAGAPLILASTTATMFGLWGQVSGPSAALALPIAAFEFAIGVWLTVKGFRPAALAALDTPASEAA